MAESPPDPEGEGPARRAKTAPTSGTPRWAKAFGVVLLVLVLVVVVMLVAGGGRHGPGRHLPSGDAAGRTAPTNLGGDRSPSASAPRHGEHGP